MRDRRQNDYCVACNDIDGITSINSTTQPQVHATGMLTLFLSKYDLK